ncbi:MAG: YafY family transcriptional regulator [Methylobacteriaceae bacterium]|nr:YafY family transcriptional regulator [Methylobacteriaceae bacterium]MBV9246511.1 YafY family transcriptional regulator [Methylobacteriaceae bacterium]MBV9636226.1 YafY family transcriptional regulator [Methylobacteriaceae bacterium]MBV9704158.1 YafY family transcriptional regulator [Methylobacteriaceae bacterium]
MARTDRLLALVQLLRRHRRAVTADLIAEELDVSVRTIYRDISTLIASRVPIRGEAGVGYILEPGFDLPPMMFTTDEVEAVLVGMRWLRVRGDTALAKAADDVLAKVGAVLPSSLQPLLFDGGLFAPTFRGRGEAPRIDEASLREAIRRERKISITYADQDGTRTSRTVWPFGLSFFNNAHVIMAWCELREDFRHFRTDRIHDLSLLEDRYPVRRTKLLRRWEEESRQKNPDLIRQD